MKVGVIVDHLRLTRWQLRALLQLPSDTSILIYNCTNSPGHSRSARHLAYYALNLLSLRNEQTRRVSLPSTLTIERIVSFECGQDGAWQRLSPLLIDQICRHPPDIIVKFGMGLLRVPSQDELPIPILSFHHGDPREFRGRPAGFYEMMSRRTTIGQVIQILSDRLDAGAVVAFAETKVYSHSYRATMIEAYRASPLLLNTAVANARANKILPIAPDGRNYRLPSNILVLRFAMDRLRAFVRRLFYGAFCEKNWMVAEARRPACSLADIAKQFPDQREWNPIKTPSGYRFIADPFYHPEGSGILVEGLRSADELGALLHIDTSGNRHVSNDGGHYSYPSSLTRGGLHYLIPEICEWSAARIYQMEESGMQEVGFLDITGSPSLIDPTIHEQDNHLFLFANVLQEGPSILRLWVSEGLHSPFVEHPSSPIRISPDGSRMGGAIAVEGDIFRVGQDIRGGYGEGVTLFKIKELSPEHYAEERIGSIRFAAQSGPHTLNMKGERVLFDFFENRISLTAGLRRLKHRWMVRRAAVEPAAERSHAIIRGPWAWRE